MKFLKKASFPIILILVCAALSIGYSAYRTLYHGDVILVNTDEGDSSE